MGNPYKLTLDKQGIKDLLWSDKVEAACLSKAQELAQKAGPSYRADSHKGSTRASANVVSDSVKEYYRNKNGDALLKKLGLHNYDGRRGGK